MQNDVIPEVRRAQLRSSWLRALLSGTQERHAESRGPVSWVPGLGFASPGTTIGGICAAITLLITASAHAITFTPGTKPDPFTPGKTCDAPKIASYGDYIYDWPSKYDLVFSPRDYPQWIWRCEASGYVSFPHEFDTFAGGEKARLAAYLKQANFGPKLKDERSGISEALLEHLEKVYDLRDNSDEFKASLLRYFAWQYRAKPKADDYRRRALALYKTMLASGTLDSGGLLQAYYILGFYSYKLGDPQSAKKYFAALKNVASIDPETKETRRGNPYLETLAKEVLAGKADDKVRFANDTN